MFKHFPLVRIYLVRRWALNSIGILKSGKKWKALKSIQNFHSRLRYRVAGYGGFVCIDINSYYHNLAALMLIFTFLSTLVKYDMAICSSASCHKQEEEEEVKYMLVGVL